MKIVALRSASSIDLSQSSPAAMLSLSDEAKTSSISRKSWPMTSFNFPATSAPSEMWLMKTSALPVDGQPEMELFDTTASYRRADGPR
jgi:hypothetical protein